jgi:two-component system, NtrC family, nitrogen regulation sensor histidine kinase NtrY
MSFSSFRANVLVRVLVLFALCLVLVWGWLNTTWVATPFLCLALLAICAVELIHYVEKVTRDFTIFLSFVAHHDYSTPLSVPQKGSVFTELQSAYRFLSDEFRRLNLQKAANLQYLETVVEHVSVALCCLDERGYVRMMNRPARRLFGLPFLNSWHTFSRIDPRLPEILQKLRDGERTLLAVTRADDNLQLLLYATTFELLGEQYKLVSFQNIRDELDRQETDSWQKLIRVLTHEIMNSVTPIISLSGLVRETMIDETVAPPAVRALDPSQQNDMLRSVTAIHTRSRGLLDFVRAYHGFARLPEPTLATVEVRPLLERVRQLMSGDAQTQGIALEAQCSDDGARVRVDAGQIEQVLINLIRNATEALAGSPGPKIILRASRNAQGEVLVQVIDNGSGIAAEHLDSVFVPFFTTKRNGTGVGLSVSRQLVQMNRGWISVRSVPGDGTVFTLKFPEIAGFVQ